MDAWANDYFRTLGFTSIHNLGEYRTSVSDVPRTLFIAIGIEMTLFDGSVYIDGTFGWRVTKKSWGMIWFKGVYLQLLESTDFAERI